MSNLTTSPELWLERQFEFEFCPDCGGDVEHHTAVPFLGNWFARCDCPRDETTCDLHPTVAAFRADVA